MLIGITGPISSGKSEAALYLSSRYGYDILVFSDIIRIEAKKRVMPETREGLQKLGRQLKEESNNEGVLADLLLKQVKGDTIIDGLRNTAEVASLRNHGTFTLLAITAPPKTRFTRLKERQRDGDAKTYEEFQALDKKESTTATFEVSQCVLMADHTIDNGNTLDEFYSALDAFHQTLND